MVCGVTVLALLAAPAIAQPQDRPIREAFLVESDGTAEKKLAAVAEYAAQERWNTAVSLLREVALGRRDAVVRVSPGRSLSLPRYCDLLLARLPAEGLAVYRRDADPQAAIWLAEADATDDERPLRSITERAFLSSSGDDALFRLAERAWERGDLDLARRYWTLLVPLSGEPGANDLPAVLRYPDSDFDLAEIRARLILCSVALGETTRARQELASFRRLHPDAAGHLAGRDGPLADVLGELVNNAAGVSGGESRTGWENLPPAPATRTFGATCDRAGFLPFELPATTVLWARSLPPSPYLTSVGRPALPPGAPLCYYPVVWRDKLFVAEAARVFGFDLDTGRAAWAIADDDPGAIYPPAAALTNGVDGEQPFPTGPLIGVPQHTLTVHGDMLYARLGPPITSWPSRELRQPASTIIALDLVREGLLAWSLSSSSLGTGDETWSFEGPPTAIGGRLYVLASRLRPQARLNALCLDAATGEILWNRSVGSPVAPPPEGASLMTHRLLTAAAGRIFVQTNHGAIISLDAADGSLEWVGWYESRPARGAAMVNSPDRNLPGACLFAGGVIVAAPADSDRLFARDAESGVELWSRTLRGGGRHLLGAADGMLVVSGERLWGLDLFTGRAAWVAGFEDPAGYGTGHGLLAGRLAYWTTREELLVVDVATGQAVQRVPLKDFYGLTTGGNLAASQDRLFMAGPEGVMAFGEPGGE